ncbi:MAG: hypothetical protein AAB922_03960 [Patescibacteria group bacterium]
MPILQKKSKKVEKYQPFCWWCGISIPTGNLCYPHRDKTEVFVWSNGEIQFHFIPLANGKWTVQKTNLKGLFSKNEAILTP